jgi:hypothetical protein
MTLDEIRVLLRFKDAPEADCAEVNALLDEHIGHVATRIAELGQLQQQLQALRQQCMGEHAASDCGILQGLAQPTVVQGAGQAGAHPQGPHGRQARPGRTPRGA